jgi:hypothetical protein
MKPLDHDKLLVQAVQILTGISRSKRDEVQVEFDTYKTFFQSVERRSVVIDKETQKVLYVKLDKEKAITHLKSRFSLYDLRIPGSLKGKP